MSVVGQAVTPAIGTLKSLVTVLVFMTLVYGGAVLVLKSRIADKKTLRIYKEVLALALLVGAALFMYWRITHT